MDNDITIRQATLEDVDLVTAIEAECFPAAEAATREQFAARLAAYADHFWIIFYQGKPVGFIDGMVTDSDVIDDEMFADASLHVPSGAWQAIFGLNVLPQYRRRGFAGRLIEQIIAQARSEGRRGVILTCKEALIHYYARFGFKNCGLSASVHGGAVWYDMRITF